jgi:hypothetical protein
LAGRAEDRDADDLKALAPDAAQCREAIESARKTQALDAEGERRFQNILTELGHG